MYFFIHMYDKNDKLFEHKHKSVFQFYLILIRDSKTSKDIQKRCLKMVKWYKKQALKQGKKNIIMKKATKHRSCTKTNLSKSDRCKKVTLVMWKLDATATTTEDVKSTFMVSKDLDRFVFKSLG